MTDSISKGNHKTLNDRNSQYPNYWLTALCLIILFSRNSRLIWCAGNHKKDKNNCSSEKGWEALVGSVLNNL